MNDQPQQAERKAARGREMTMTTHDPLAHDRFCDIVFHAIGGIDPDPEWEPEVDAVVANFPTNYFERTVNEHGVAVRRVHVVSEWEVDPEPAKRCPNCAPGYDCESGVYVR